MEPQPPPIKVTIDELTAPVRIGDDAAVFPHFKANFILGGHRAEVRFEATADRVVATEVTLTATDTKTGITAEPLSWLARSLPPAHRTRCQRPLAEAGAERHRLASRTGGPGPARTAP